MTRYPAGSRTCPLTGCDEPNVEGNIHCAEHAAPDGVSRIADCALCGGPCAQKRFAGAFVDDTWLHVRDTDWIGNPHNVLPINIRTVDRRERV